MVLHQMSSSQLETAGRDQNTVHRTGSGRHQLQQRVVCLLGELQLCGCAAACLVWLPLSLGRRHLCTHFRLTLSIVLTCDCSPLHLQQLREVLHKRLNMKNPHKVWLATHLCEAILEKCSDVVGPIRSDIYQVHAKAESQKPSTRSP